MNTFSLLKYIVLFIVSVFINPTVFSQSVGVMKVSGKLCPGIPIAFAKTGSEGTINSWTVSGGDHRITKVGDIGGTGGTIEVTWNSEVRDAWVEVSTSAGSARCTINIINTTTPLVSLTLSKSDICQTETVACTATPANAGTYSWFINNEATPRQSGTSNKFSTPTLPAGPNTIKVILNSFSECSPPPTSDVKPITVRSPQNIQMKLVDPGRICSNNWTTSVNLISGPPPGSGTLTYTWTKNEGTVTKPEDKPFIPDYVFPTTAVNGDKIKCVVTTTASCYNSAKDSIIANIIPAYYDPPSLSLGVSTTHICKGEELVFTVSGNGQIDNSSIYWGNSSCLGTVSPDGTKFTTKTLTNTGFVKVEAKVTITTESEGCRLPASGRPTSTFSGNLISIDDSASAWIDPIPATICSGSQLNLTAHAANTYNNPNFFKWYVNGSLIPNWSGNTYPVSRLPLGLHKVYVQVYSYSLCNKGYISSGEKVTTILKKPVFTVDIGGGGIICPDADLTGRTFHAQVPDSDPSLASLSYKWSDGGTMQGTPDNQYYSPIPNQVYCEITGTAANGCSSSDTGYYTVQRSDWENATLELNKTSPSANDICAGKPITFTASSDGNIEQYYAKWWVNDKYVENPSITLTTNNFQAGITNKVKFEAYIQSSDTKCIQRVRKDVTITPAINVYSYPEVSIDPTGVQSIYKYSSLPIQASTACSGCNYQWQKDNVDIQNAVNSNYNATTAGSYHVIVSNHGCASESDPVTLTVNEPVAIYNSVSSKVFGQGETVIAEGITYSDVFGKALQTQARNITDNSVVVNQTYYDNFGRPLMSTLPAVIAKTDLDYVTGFGTNSGDDIEFDTPDEYSVLDLAIDANSPLGSYYSNSGPEPYVPETNYPYTSVEYSNTVPGTIRKTTLAGAEHRLGQGHEAESYSMPVNTNELEFFSSTIASLGLDVTLETNKLIKNISIDADNKQSIVYSTSDGLVVSSCIADNSATLRTYIAKLTELGYLDIHTQSTSITTSGNCEIVDLATDDLISNSGTSHTLTNGSGCYRVVYLGSNVPETITVTYKTGYNYHSFNFYDRAGRLKRSMSPKDVEEWVLGTITRNKTTFDSRTSYKEYNSLSQLVKTSSPDEGITNYKYRKDGLIRYSQNGKQVSVSPNCFSYTEYDNTGRIIEVGEFSSATFLFSGADPDQALPLDTRSYRNYTIYDIADPNIIQIQGYKQNFTMGRVSKTWNDNVTTWYSYTYDGNVEWMIQEAAGFDPVVLNYIYDFTGNVTSVKYQLYKASAFKDGFEHIYTYDADNRLSVVTTKEYNDDGTLKEQKQQARYLYYKHGALKRVELAGELQGIDYVYTINGWLKSINHPNLSSGDPGADGTANSFSKDKFGISFDYFSGDYRKTLSSIPATNLGNNYSGNISGERWKTDGQSATGDHQIWKYEYDNRNFLKKAEFGSSTLGSNTLTANYKVDNLIYDANGNIKSLTRNGYGTNPVIDNLTYTYKTGKNQLDYVNDGIVTDSYSDDIADQSAGNYTYNAIGQLTDNIQDNHYFEYDVYGHVTRIKDVDGEALVDYTYDDKGYRVKKTVHSGTATQKTWYVRDASGNIISVYTSQNDDTPLCNEMNIYGASRLGMAQVNTEGNIEKYLYELTDHLGNVRAVITDLSAANDMIVSEQLTASKTVTARNSITLGAGFDSRGFEFEAKIDPNASAGSQLLSYADYYPGGMVMPGRMFISGSQSRWDYQGQYAEHDFETGYHQFEARLYDSRILRFTTTDPARQDWSSYMAMGNRWTSTVDPDGRSWKDWFGIKSNGEIVFLKEADGPDRLYKVDDNGNIIDNNKFQLINDKNLLPDLMKFREGFKGNYAITNNLNDAGNFFLFAAENSDVEWSFRAYKNKTKDYLLSTNHLERHLNIPKIFNEMNLTFSIHSHVGYDDTPGASYTGGTVPGDWDYIRDFYKSWISAGKDPQLFPTHAIYQEYNKTVYYYTPWKRSIQGHTFK